MTVEEAIAAAETILPGAAAPEGKYDARWQAVIAVAEFIQSEPEAVWVFIERWGDHSDADLRAAIATCALELLLEEHFDAFYDRVAAKARASAAFAETVSQCWVFLGKKSPQSLKFERLRKSLRRSTGQ